MYVIEVFLSTEQEYIDSWKNNLKKVLLEKIYKCDIIIVKLKNVNSKENICKECVYLFYESTFAREIDTNPYLICFRNGVLDLRGNKFRKGESSDMITLMIDYDFKFPSKSLDKKNMSELIEQFQLFRKKIIDSRTSKHKTTFSPLNDE